MATTSRSEMYRCNVCGNIVHVFNPGAQSLVCCGQKMELLAENTVDAAIEKHVPVVEKISGGYKVSVGEVLHPMEEKHYIQWIELLAGNELMVKFLKPGEEPVAEFKTNASDVKAREYCNLHGQWST
jgi:superoxide reductase